MKVLEKSVHIRTTREYQNLVTSAVEYEVLKFSFLVSIILTIAVKISCN